MVDDLALALGAGLLAAVNPCGFALLPAYLSLLVLDEGGHRAAAVGRALVSTAAMTLGFVAVFGVFGLVVSPLASGVQRYLPWVTVVLGVGLVLAGVWLLAGRSLPVLGWSPSAPSVRRRFSSLFGFGVAYALASLTCTVAPFLVVVVSAFRSGSVLEGLALFVAYGLGMGLLVGVAAVAVALLSTTAIDRMRRFGSMVPRLAGGLLVVVGAYVGYYGWWELRVLDGASATDPVIGGAAVLQGQISTAVRTLGVGGMAALLVAVIGLGLVITALRRSAGSRSSRVRRRGAES